MRGKCPGSHTSCTLINTLHVEQSRWSARSTGRGIPCWSAMLPSNRERVVSQSDWLGVQSLSGPWTQSLPNTQDSVKCHIKMDGNITCSTAWAAAVLGMRSCQDAERAFPQSTLSLSSRSSSEARAGCAGAFPFPSTRFRSTPQNRLRSKDRPPADSCGQI